MVGVQCSSRGVEAHWRGAAALQQRLTACRPRDVKLKAEGESDAGTNSSRRRRWPAWRVWRQDVSAVVEQLLSKEVGHVSSAVRH